MAASAGPDPQPLLSVLPDLPVAKALLEELAKLTDFATGQDIAQMVDTSWAALALGQDPAARGVGTLLFKADAQEKTPRTTR